MIKKEIVFVISDLLDLELINAPLQVRIPSLNKRITDLQIHLVIRYSIIIFCVSLFVPS